MEKLLKRQTATVEHIDNLWETYQSKSKKDELTHKEDQSYREELERLRDRFNETDEELMEFKDFVNTEYYKRKVPQVMFSS